MAFNVAENTQFVTNPSLEICTGPVPVDQSSRHETFYQYQPNSSAGTSNGITCYNGVECVWDVHVPTTDRLRLDKSYIVVKGYAGLAATPATPVVTNVTGAATATSIPWNAYAALINKAEIQLNQSAITVESITQNFGDGNMVKMLTRYSKQALDAMEDTMFTPVLEEQRDFVGVMSVASATRGATWLTNGAAGTTRPHSKNLYLNDIFDSCRTPAGFFVQNLRLKITPKATTEILFEANAVPVGAYFITNIQLYLCFTTLTEIQIEEDRKRLDNNEAMMLQTFTAYDAKQKPFSAGASVRDSNVKNLQAAVMLIPSTSVTDGAAHAKTGINRYQYCYGSDLLGVTGLTQYQMRYEGIPVPNFPLTIDATLRANNTNLYAQYRSLCTKMADREIAPALSASYMTKENTAIAGNVTDINAYVLYCASFYPDIAACHRTMAGSDLEVTTSGGSGAASIIVVYIRNSFLEIRGDTQVYVIN